MKIATDIGGTFTDIVVIDDAGNVVVDKVDTTPPNFEKGVIEAIKKVQNNPREIDMTEEITSLIHGTTVVINALTERKGGKTALLTTKGFRDIYEIARGNRPDLFNFRYEKSVPFVPRYLRREVEERMDYLGEEVIPLNKDDVRKWIEYFKKEEVEAIGVMFINSYRNDTHERETVEMIRDLWPEVYVTGSYEVTNEWREYERTSTTALNAFVQPVATAYLDKLEKQLEDVGAHSKKYIMQSNGGSTTFEKAKETPINMVESGPVAGIYGAAVLGQMIGEDKIIAFDIGGTTAKCSLIDDGEVKVTTDYKIDQSPKKAGHPIKVPVVDIVEIGNGGGSIAYVDDRGALRVGPVSAGANPGPIAYGLGNIHPTTTDANLVAGRLDRKNFSMDVDMDAVRAGIRKDVADPLGISIEDGALGIIRIANSNMLNALKLVSVRKGYDPREFTLVAFGGGGPMHAAGLAGELGIKKVVIPKVASVFSAWGMLMSDLRQDDIKTNIMSLGENTDYDTVEALWKELENKALADFAEKGISVENVSFVRNLDMRYADQEHTVKVVQGNKMLTKDNYNEVVKGFEIEHNKAYHFIIDGCPTEIVNLHLVSFGRVEKPAVAKLEKTVESSEKALKEIRDVLFEGYGLLPTKVYLRPEMTTGMEVEGPAIIEEVSSSCLLYPGMKAKVDGYENIVIETGVK